MNNNKKYAVIVAGGKGTRMGTAIPKQFLPLLGKPLLCYAIEAFAKAIPDIRIILVLPADQLVSAKTILRSYIGDYNVTVVAGGETRYHSVQNGLKQISNDGIVFVHDGARPLISTDLILRCYRGASDLGSAIPSIAVAESMRLVEGDSSRPINRDHLRVIQTPQTFRTELILPAFAQEYLPSFTDEATVVESLGGKIHLMEGMIENLKITTPEDMIQAEAFLNVRK
jgi:2-C-methyl-D-erythritol 4-phosphate cytidylyltransferase